MRVARLGDGDPRHDSKAGSGKPVHVVGAQEVILEPPLRSLTHVDWVESYGGPP